MTLYEKRSKNMTLLVPYIPLAPKIPIESGSNSNLEPPPPVRTSDRYGYRYNYKVICQNIVNKSLFEHFVRRMSSLKTVTRQRQVPSH